MCLIVLKYLPGATYRPCIQDIYHAYCKLLLFLPFLHLFYDLKSTVYLRFIQEAFIGFEKNVNIRIKIKKIKKKKNQFFFPLLLSALSELPLGSSSLSAAGLPVVLSSLDLPLVFSSADLAFPVLLVSPSADLSFPLALV